LQGCGLAVGRALVHGLGDGRAQHHLELLLRDVRPRLVRGRVGGRVGVRVGVRVSVGVRIRVGVRVGVRVRMRVRVRVRIRLS